MFIVDRVLNGDEKPSSPAKSDTLKSTDSASGGDTLDDRSSKEVSIHSRCSLLFLVIGICQVFKIDDREAYIDSLRQY